MLDLETLSVDDNATIISVAAVQFDLETGKIGSIYNTRISLLDQLLNNSEVSFDTLAWWSNQSIEAKQKLSAIKELSVKNFLVSFNDWIKDTIADTKKVRLWGNGIAADNVWLRNLYKRHNHDFVLQYWSDNDVRTIVQLVDYDKVKEITGAFVGVKHDAVDDCKHQIKLCHNSLQIITKLYGDKNARRN